MPKVRTALLSSFMPLFMVASLTGCDQVMEVLNKQKANGKAIGAACRHSGRALEDCYRRNPKISKADIFTGWKEMNEYMLQKKLDVVPAPPDLPASSGSKAGTSIASLIEDADENDEESAQTTEKSAHGKPD